MISAPLPTAKLPANDSYYIADADLQLDKEINKSISKLEILLAQDIALARLAIIKNVAAREKILFLKMFDDFVKYVSEYEMDGGTL